MAENDTSCAADIAAWFGDQVPDDWFDGAAHVIADRDEILVVGILAIGDDRGDDAPTAEAHIVAFRERTRDHRVAIAARAETLFARKVSWGAEAGGTRMLFTHLSVPVMTRLRVDERHVLDTLVGAGVARSRSDALGWCVRLVAEHESDWIAELRDALATVEAVRARRSS